MNSAIMSGRNEFLPYGHDLADWMISVMSGRNEFLPYGHDLADWMISVGWGFHPYHIKCGDKSPSSTVYRLPSTVYRLPSTVYRLPSTVYQIYLYYLLE